MATPDSESKRKIRSCCSYEKKQAAASAKFMSVVPDDLSVEIFLRFPTSLSVMRCATVCKRWCSLIINPYSRKFIRTFIQYHLRKQSLDSSYTPSQTTNILFNYSEFNYGLRVWELDSDSYTWLLVHDFDFGENTDGGDPNDGNILFLVQGEHIYRYEIEQNKYGKICEFPCNGEPIDDKKLTISKSSKVSTLVHPLWPTPTLTLPPST